MDSRCVEGSGQLGVYMPSSEGEKGRFPDVFFELRGLGRFAVEVQLAPIQVQTIRERSDFYLREGVRLIWVSAWEPVDEADRAFRNDLATAALGNHFVFDAEAAEASAARGALVLKAIWSDASGRQKRLFGLDDLILSERRLPFLIDAHTAQIFADADRLRMAVETCLVGRDIWLPTFSRACFDRGRWIPGL